VIRWLILAAIAIPVIFVLGFVAYAEYLIKTSESRKNDRRLRE
jgi:hypothetical protein